MSEIKFNHRRTYQIPNSLIKHKPENDYDAHVEGAHTSRQTGYNS